MEVASGELAEHPTETLNLAKRLIVRALRYRPALPAETAVLRNLAHDADLLPAIKRQLDSLLNLLPKELHITYDIQGLRDSGTDILIRLTSKGEETYVGLQVKSHKELIDQDLTNKLVLQWSESMDHWGKAMHLWCPILCADISSKNQSLQQRLRSIRKVFAKKSGTNVIDPGYVYAFLNLRPTQMSSLVTLTARTGDPVIADARADLIRHPVQSAILISTVCETLRAQQSQWVTVEQLEQSTWLQHVAWLTPWTGYEGQLARDDVQPWDAEHQERSNESYWYLEDDPDDSRVEEDEDEDREDDEDDEDDEEYGLIDISDPAPNALSWLLHPPDEVPNWQTAAARLRQRLPAAIEALVEDGALIEGEPGQVTALPSAHPAVYALAAEAVVRYDHHSAELADYLIATVLPPAKALDLDYGG